MARSTTDGVTTATQILDVAQRLAQTRGFNGFSYADIAAEVGITTASLHYHFPTKAALGRALIVRYTDAFQAALEAIEMSPANASTKLRDYAHIYEQVLGDDRMCLCGMLAAEYATLPAPMQQAVQHFFDHNEDWLVAVLEAGRRDGVVQFRGTARDAARSLTGALEGSMLLARSYSDPARFEAAVERALNDLEPLDATRARTKPAPASRLKAARR